MEAKQKRNRPIRTVLKEYVEHQRGKVVNAREELHRRFDGLDWSIQKKILTAHLEASYIDREWACTRLLQLWDNYFFPLVQRIWENYHEERCSWIIIRHFPQYYIMDQLEWFNFKRNYFHICLRFGHEEGFVIDKTKLSPEDTIYLHYRHSLKLESHEAEELLNQIILNALRSYWHTDIAKKYLTMRVTRLHPTLILKLDQSLYYIKQMKIEPVATSFSDWCDSMAKIMNESPEWKRLKSSSLSDYDFYDLAYRIVLKYLCLHLPCPVLNKFFKPSPDLDELAEKLDLHIDYDRMLFESYGINLWDKLDCSKQKPSYWE
ncbi:MAG: hypothetical protein J5554_02760 [Paludibacteraceae bacterium]|nr:hypothetical protein [Paludibacteraceae bacterium]